MGNEMVSMFKKLAEKSIASNTISKDRLIEIVKSSNTDDEFKNKLLNELR